MNPFHLWLGLPEKSANPNHYQLLGIKASEQDAQVIEQAARQCLSRLKSVTPNDNQVEAHEKIKQRIIKAHTILSDDTSRAEYDAKLLTKLAEQKRNQAASVSSKLNPSTVDANPSPPPATGAEVVSPSGVQSAGDQIPIAQLTPQAAAAEPQILATDSLAKAGQPNIPMAVPIASQAPVAAVLPDGETADLNKIAVKSAKFKRRKKSWLVPVFCLILCLGGIAGLTYVVINLDAIRGTGAATENPINKNPFAGPKVANPVTTENVPAAGSIDPKESDPNIMPSDLSPDDPPGNDKKTPDTPPPNVSYEKLDFNQLVQFRRYIENARRGMYRRDAETAQNEIHNAQALFKRFDKNDIALEPSQTSMKEIADGVATIKSLLEGFWKQVVTSSVGIPAGQPIEVTGQSLGFVDGTESFVILRIDGTNVTFDYEFLPPGIAMALAEQGTIDDMPAYRMQKAACYAVHTHLDPKYRERAATFAKRAAIDGHDPNPILQFINFDSTTVGVPKTKAAQLSDAAMRDKLPKHMSQLGFDDFGKMRPDQAARGIVTALESAVQVQDDSRRAMSFEIAYKLAVKAGDIREVNDVLDEYRLWIKINYQERARRALIDVSKQKLDDRKSRLLLNAMIDCAKNSDDKQFKTKLLKTGQKLASQYKLDDQLSRLQTAAAGQ